MTSDGNELETVNGRRVQAFAETHGPTSYDTRTNSPDDGDHPTIVDEDLASGAYNNGIEIIYLPESKTNIDGGAIGSYVAGTGAQGYFTAFMEGGPDEIEELTRELRENPESFGVYGFEERGRGVLNGWESIEADLDRGLGSEARKNSAARLGACDLAGIEKGVNEVPIGKVDTPTEKELYIRAMDEVSNWEGPEDGTLKVDVPDRDILPNAMTDVVRVLDESGYNTEELTIGGAQSQRGSIEYDVFVRTPSVTQSHVYDVSTADGFELSEPSNEDSEEDSGWLEKIGIR